MLSKDQHCLDSILESIKKIQIYTLKFETPDQFNNEHLVFDAVMITKISADLQNLHPEIEWNKIKGFRNLVAHDYFGIDAEEVWQIIFNDLPVLQKQATAILCKS